MTDLPTENLDQLRLIKRKEADDVIAFANVMAKNRYNNNHMVMKLEAQAYLRLHHGYSIFEVNLKLFNQRVGPFKVLEKVGNLAYRLELPGVMRIHPIIFIAQLEPASDRSDDPYSRTFTQPIPLIEETQEEIDPDFASKHKFYEIERLLKRRDIERNTKYLVKWKNCGNEHNV